MFTLLDVDRSGKIELLRFDRRLECGSACYEFCYVHMFYLLCSKRSLHFFKNVLTSSNMS